MNIRRNIDVSFLVLFSSICEAQAGELKGLAGMEVVIPTILVTGFVFLVLLVLSLLRFLRTQKKTSLPLTITGLLVVIGALICLNTLGYGIDPGFEIFCYGLIAVSLILIGFNYRIKR